jgi:chorismate dehydratase
MSGSGKEGVGPEPLADLRKELGRRLRVGGIDYLNSRPLLEGLPEALGEHVEIVNCVPSELARRLRSGDLDVALVPVAEYFAGPPEYRIIPRLAIASYGAVESIRLFHKVPLREVERVGLDSASLTSGALVRLFFAEKWAEGRPQPSYVPISREEGLSALGIGQPELDAVLLIGDLALQASPSLPAWHAVDLGMEWTRRTGLPFVYAFWVYRGPPAPALVRLFRRAFDLGRARIDAIVERGPLPTGMSVPAARHYLERVIRYDLGPAEIEGLLAFRDRAQERGILQVRGSGELRFLATEEGEARG